MLRLSVNKQTPSLGKIRVNTIELVRLDYYTRSSVLWSFPSPHT